MSLVINHVLNKTDDLQYLRNISSSQNHRIIIPQQVPYDFSVETLQKNNFISFNLLACRSYTIHCITRLANASSTFSPVFAEVSKNGTFHLSASLHPISYGT